jgi:hypothetical protein
LSVHLLEENIKYIQKRHWNWETLTKIEGVYFYLLPGKPHGFS